MSKYPELDASVEAGDELDAWKEKCHALEASLADFAQELHRQTMLAEYRKVLINESKAENVRLRAMLPDAETRQDIREWANEHSNVRAALVLVWLDKFESEAKNGRP